MRGGSAGTLSGSQQLLAHPLGDGLTGPVGSGSQRRIFRFSEAHGAVDRPGVINLGPAGAGCHAAEYSDNGKDLTGATLATTISHMTATAAVEAQQAINPGWGEDYGMGRVAYVVPGSGTCVWMFRKGQRVRFFDTNGQQVGPEHANVMPAICWASGQAWIDPFQPNLSIACTVEVRSQTAARRQAALRNQERGVAA